MIHVSNRENPPAFRSDDVYLKPGQWFMGRGNFCVRTLLGSCVALVFWHAPSKTGSICHYMLPSVGRDGKSEQLDARYADQALQLLATGSLQNGFNLSQCITKVFGGADMFQLDASTSASIGKKNVEAARHLIEQYQLRVDAQNLGGERHRQIVFSLIDGKTWMRLGHNCTRADFRQSCVDGGLPPTAGPQ